MVLLLTSRIVFFVDQSLSGKAIPQAICQFSGYPAEMFVGNFEIDADDVDWLPVIGKRGWILITKDYGILTSPVEREALLNAGVRAFVFRRQTLSDRVTITMLKLFMPRMIRTIDRYRAPFVYVLDETGLEPVSNLVDI